MYVFIYIRVYISIHVYIYVETSSCDPPVTFQLGMFIHYMYYINMSIYVKISIHECLCKLIYIHVLKYVNSYAYRSPSFQKRFLVCFVICCIDRIVRSFSYLCLFWLVYILHMEDSFWFVLFDSI
jgi:hypothetical protein